MKNTKHGKKRLGEDWLEVSSWRSIKREVQVLNSLMNKRRCTFRQRVLMAIMNKVSGASLVTVKRKRRGIR